MTSETSRSAIERIEEVEDELARVVREANDEAEGTTMNPILDAGEVADLREQLTDARADLVDALLDEALDDNE